MNPKDQTRAEIVSRIEAAEYARIIAESVRVKIERYINLDILATTSDDHTKSLSERMEHLEGQLGHIRDDMRHLGKWASEQDRLARLSWWRRMAEKRKYNFPFRLWYNS